MKTIANPILRGFNPDPSIVRVGEDYYIATSTFEWYPGVQIHHSRDLVHWRLLTRPLCRASQLDLRGDPSDHPCPTAGQEVFGLPVGEVRVHLPGEEHVTLELERRHPGRARMQAVGKLHEATQVAPAAYGRDLDCGSRLMKDALLRGQLNGVGIS